MDTCGELYAAFTCVSSRSCVRRCPMTEEVRGSPAGATLARRMARWETANILHIFDKRHRWLFHPFTLWRGTPIYVIHTFYIVQGRRTLKCSSLYFIAPNRANGAQFGECPSVWFIWVDCIVFRHHIDIYMFLREPVNMWREGGRTCFFVSGKWIRSKHAPIVQGELRQRNGDCQPNSLKWTRECPLRIRYCCDIYYRESLKSELLAICTKVQRHVTNGLGGHIIGDRIDHSLFHPKADDFVDNSHNMWNVCWSK